MGGDNEAAGDGDSYHDEVDSKDRDEDRTANQPDSPRWEVGNGDDKGCQDQENERVDACASVKLYLLSLSVGQQAEGEGAQDVGDGRADDVANGQG